MTAAALEAAAAAEAAGVKEVATTEGQVGFPDGGSRRSWLQQRVAEEA